VLAPEWQDPRGVPISAILFGGRRADTVPLVNEARDWQHGVFLGATLSSERTAAATGQVGVVRRDPMAMRPFIGYDVGAYLQHWIDVGKQADAAVLPKIFYVNWFRRDDDGRFLWPGFGENGRVLKWIIERVEGSVPAVETAIGHRPAPDGLDLTGLAVSGEDVEAALRVDGSEWRREVASIAEWFDQVGERLPSLLRAELDDLRQRLEIPPHPA
jgi:phosphoenolpyruvate carboxykinase (GTP)